MYFQTFKIEIKLRHSSDTKMMVVMMISVTMVVVMMVMIAKIATRPRLQWELRKRGKAEAATAYRWHCTNIIFFHTSFFSLQFVCDEFFIVAGKNLLLQKNVPFGYAIRSCPVFVT